MATSSSAAKSPRRKTGGQAKSRKDKPLLPPSVVSALQSAALRSLGVLLILASLAGFLALASYSPADPSGNVINAGPVANWIGRPGAWMADFLLQTLGIAALVLLIIPTGWGWRLASLRGLPWFWTHVLVLFGMLGCLTIAAAALFSANWPTSAGAGGLMGRRLLSEVDSLLKAMGLMAPFWVHGSIFSVLGALSFLATVGLDRDEWTAIARTTGRMLAAGPRWLGTRLAGSGEAAPKRFRKAARKPRQEPALDPAKARARAESQRVKPSSKPKAGARLTKERQRTLDFGDSGDFRLPQLDLLTAPQEKDRQQQVSREALEQNARILESVLDDFGIKGEIIQVRPGPVVTLYELEPAPGTKASRVIGLADDIARSMSAIAARVAVVPGRNAIGIELPNQKRQTVLLHELLASGDFESTKARLPLTLGKDISGAPIIADLASMPHLLVAGTTGSGKSVGINTMILSLLYRLPPEACRFIMVDPKMLELSVYDGIPHLLTPVVTEPKKAVVALKWAVREMEDRYRAMSKLGVRNIAAYNKRVAEAQAGGEKLKRTVQTGFDRESGQPIYEEQEFDFEPLPLIVIVIDEMADLMLVAGKDVEATVQRLAQMARAAGLHVIMATQRPSVDVITGTIKANFPTRISYQVTSKIDSRTILGEQGAEQLLGQGDMLYMAGGGRITRVHGAFVSDQEVEDVVAYLKTQGAPEYLDDVTEEPPEGFDSPFIPGPSDDNPDASLYDKAVDVVLRDRRPTTSYIQRKLRIGYNRAASLIEEMEQNGVISAANHAGKREVLAPTPED